MKVTVNQQSLSKALGLAGRAVSSRTTMPVLGNILLDAKNNQLRVAATNREIGVNVWIGAKVEDEGAITLPARLLSEFVNSLPPEQISIELNVRTLTARLSCARFEANMKGIDAFEFPALPTLDSLVNSDDAATGVQVALSPTQLRRAIDQTTFAASQDENRPTLTGVEVTLSPDCVQMAATDGYRLSVRTMAIENGPEKTVVIVPAKSLGEVARISSDADDSEPVQCLITPKRNQIMFAMSGSEKAGIQRMEMVSELIDARFPDYRATIPKSHTTRTVVDTASLLKAVRVALLFARDNANIVRLRMAPDGGIDNRGQMYLTATSAEIGDNVSDLSAMVDGPVIEIGMNAKYLIDVLSQVEQPQITLETTQPTRPMAVKPLGEDGYLHVIMPMYNQK